MAREAYTISQGRARSLADRGEQFRRMEERYGLRYGTPRYNLARRAFDNAVERGLLAQGPEGRMIRDVSAVEDGRSLIWNNNVMTERGTNITGMNTLQRLYNMSRMGNATADRLLNRRLRRR